MRRFLLILWLLWPAGCNWKLGGKDFVDPAPPVVFSSTQPSEPAAAPAEPAASRTAPPKITKAVDPTPIVRPSVGLSVVQISVPVGAISRNEAFWKRIEERAIDIGTYDILQKNGFRAGLGAAAELETLLRPFDRTQISPQAASFIASNVKTIELPMKQAVPEQIIYDFDLKNVLTVRTYEEADYLLVLDFQPAPRKAGDVRISLCPLIRTLRRKLVPISDIETKEFEFRNPEKFFPLNLTLDLPLDGFLIIAPSPQAQSAMSLGHNFLMREGSTQRYETALLITPQPVNVSPKPADKREGQPG